MLNSRKFTKQYKPRPSAAPMKAMPLPTGTGEEIGEPKSSAKANAAEENAEYNDGDTSAEEQGEPKMSAREQMAEEAAEAGAKRFTKDVHARAKKHARKK